jgi:hypothetical protein
MNQQAVSRPVLTQKDSGRKAMSTKYGDSRNSRGNGENRDNWDSRGSGHAPDQRSDRGYWDGGDRAERTPERGSRARPIHEIRIGYVKAAIWENSTERGPRYNVTINRRYKVEDGWRDTHSLGRDDLLNAAKVMDLCHTWIYDQMAKHAQTGNPAPSSSGG